MSPREFPPLTLGLCHLYFSHLAHIRRDSAIWRRRLHLEYYHPAVAIEGWFAVWFSESYLFVLYSLGVVLSDLDFANGYGGDVGSGGASYSSLPLGYFHKGIPVFRITDSRCIKGAAFL